MQTSRIGLTEGSEATKALGFRCFLVFAPFACALNSRGASFEQVSGSKATAPPEIRTKGKGRMDPARRRTEVYSDSPCAVS